MRKLYIPITLFLALFSSAVFAQINLTPNASGAQLAQIMSGPGVIISNVVLNCPNGAAGSFTCNNCSLNMDSGIVLTTGKVANIAGPNNQNQVSYAWGSAGDQDLANLIGAPVTQLHDACVLEFDLTAQSDSVQFKYIFGSDEYPEFVCSTFNDVFAFFISGPGIVGLQNLALIPGTAIPVSINSVNPGTPGGFSGGGSCNGANQSLTYSQYYVNNGDGTVASQPYYSNPYYIQYDGFTKTLVAAVGGLIACQTYHLKLAVSDVSDGAIDSGVFIEANSLSSNLVTFDTTGTAIPGLDSAIRGCVDGIFTLQFQKPVSVATTVNYTTGGTAVNGTDYTNISGTVQFAAGDSMGHVVIHPIGAATQTQTVKLYLTSGCGTVYDSTTLYIIAPPQLVVGPDTTVCPGDSVRLHATPGATLYAWSPGTAISSTSISNPYVFPTTTTVYTCTATAIGCASSASVTITVYSTPPFSVSAGPDIVACGGGTAQLNATVTGTPLSGHPFTYNWTPSTNLSNASIANPVDLSASTNTYIVFVTSGHCSASDTINVTVDSVSETMSSTMTKCSYSTDGTATATPVTGVAPFGYSWTSGANTITATALSPGLYYVTITDNKSCKEIDTITVYAPAPIVFGAPTIVSVSCPGGSNGSATITATGGTGAITYSWSSGSVTSTASNLTAGPYTVTATDANLCTATTTVTVSTLPSVTTTITVTNVSCFGGADGTATANANGGTAPYLYSWSNTLTTNPITALGIGPYSVTVTDNGGCTVSATSNITQPVTLSVSEVSTNVSCFNGADGTITLTITGGTTPYSFLWTDASQQQDRNSLAVGYYKVTVTDAHSCTDTTSATLTQPTVLVLTTTVVNATCYGASNGSIDLSVTGGTPPYSYNWGIGIFSQNATNIPADYYYPSVTDNAGCVVDTSIHLTSPGKIVFNGSTTTDVSCFGGSDGTIQVNPTNGVGNFTFTWNGVPGNNPDSNLIAGTYNVIATDGNTCTASTAVTVNQPPQLGVTINGQNALCFGGADGNATDVVTGGTQPYSYLWNDGQNKVTAVSLVPGIYQSTVTDNNHCTASAMVTITAPNKIIFTIDSTPVKCIGSKDGTLTLNVLSGGVPPYTYAATQNPSTFITTTDSMILGLGTGYYLVQVSDNNGCIMEDSAFVPNAIPDAFNITTDSTSCFGPQYTDGAIHVTGLVPQNSPFQYSVDASALQFSSDFFNLAAGSHNISITNVNGCVTDTSAVIGAPIQGIAEVYPVDTTIQLGETIQLFSALINYQSSAITSYNWVPSTGLSCVDCPAPVVSIYNHINTYTLTITYNNGCIASAQSRVIVIGTPPVYIPNTFTPNGDGNNDVFLIYGENIKTVGLKVFNRWGEKVFDSENQFLGWDGNYKGMPQMPGVYVYEAQITFLDNTQTLRTGSITLLK